MKENKFRGISQYTDSMVYGQLLRGENNFNIVTNFSTRAIDIELVPIKKGTQGQFTGLLDKKGREIFDGDIVKSATQNNIIKFEYGSFMVVGFHEDKYERTYSKMSYFLVDVTMSDEQHSRFDGVTTTLEVIGNIHENPKMLNIQ